MKTVCIYHSIDLDGWMSAAIGKHWWNKEIKRIDDTLDFIGYNYGQPIPDLSEYDKVIMVDISFDADTMYMLRLRNNLIWIDHHISAIKNIEDNKQIEDEIIEGLRDTKFAACELTWQYFFPNKPMPEIVKLLGRYDCFGHKGTPEEQKVLEFQYGARNIISNYEEAYRWLINSIDDISITDNIRADGQTIYSYLCTEAKQSYKNGFEVWFGDGVQTSAGNTYKFICINKERFNPINFGIDYHTEGYDGCACFHRTNSGKWTFSLYNNNGEVDCSVIAKQHGGGGHKGAAGFVTDNIDSIIK